MGSHFRQVRNFGDIDRVVRSDLGSSRFCLSSDVRNVLHHGRAKRALFRNAGGSGDLLLCRCRRCACAHQNDFRPELKNKKRRRTELAHLLFLEFRGAAGFEHSLIHKHFKSVVFPLLPLLLPKILSLHFSFARASLSIAISTESLEPSADNSAPSWSKFVQPASRSRRASQESESVPDSLAR